ncbi:hypothetical protein [Yoonia sp. 208BN28-4]|uniref:hypothetical protein n=1 Tax=Yoonia sp. 208BN28-4 TaxID=3126505 RepID=UPI00309A56B0
MTTAADNDDLADISTIEPTPAHVAETAMISDVLPLDELTLLGIFGKPTGNTALLRKADGEILTLAAGDAAAGMTIAAIDDDAVHLTDARGTMHVLTIPAG